MTTILTIALEQDAQEWFEKQRQRWFPPERNLIPAHLTLFHASPYDASTRNSIARAARRAAFELQVTGIRSLGRGVAYTLQSEEAQRVHAMLRADLEAYLTAQDRQPFRPHIVVQNKATPEAARELLARLQAEFQPRTVMADALLWWEYLGGPWRLIERFPFSL